MGGGSQVARCASPLASNAARETRSRPQRLLDETPHLPIGNLHGVTICRELNNSDQVIKSEQVGTDRAFFGGTHIRETTFDPPLQTTPGLSRHVGGSFLNRFSPKIGNLHGVIIGELQRVTIRRELMHADQINKFEHRETDRERSVWGSPSPRRPLDVL